MQLNQQQIQAEAQEKEKERQHELQLESLKGEYRLRQETIQAAGRAADSKSDAESRNFVAKMSDQAIRETEGVSKIELDRNRLESSNKIEEQKMKIKMQELSLKAKELSQRAREDDTRRYVASVNKN